MKNNRKNIRNFSIIAHIDHGKSTLADRILEFTETVSDRDMKSQLLDTMDLERERGITIKLNAVELLYKSKKGDSFVFHLIDTPGHVDFTYEVSRSLAACEGAILVVDAAQGIEAQTLANVYLALDNGLDIIPVINKIDLPSADPEKVKTQMQERSIPSEDWGGDVVTIPISALNGDNVSELLEMILLQSELMELKANPDANAEGVIVEARQEVGRGPTATVIVNKGTLKVGDSIQSGSVHCKVKAMIDDQGNQLKNAPPSTPVNILGWSDVPEAGASFVKFKNEREARRQAEESAIQHKTPQHLPSDSEDHAEVTDSSGVDALFAAISKSKATTYRVILKADVRGSLEAFEGSLDLIEREKVLLEVLQAEVGQVTKNDIKMASTSGADVLGFNVKLENGVIGQAKHLGVNVYQNNIIYEIIDLVKDNMASLLEPELVEKKTGRAEVRQIFRVSKGRVVAGSMVMEGSIGRNKVARLMRGGEMIAEGKVETLKRFKDDVTEVKAGFECGIRLDSFDKYEEGDFIETFEIEKISATL